MDVEIKHGYSFDVEMTLVPNGIVNTQLTFEFRGWQGVAGGGRWGGGGCWNFAKAQTFKNKSNINDIND